MAALAADRQRQVIALGVVFGDRRAGFHEIGDDARIDDRDFRYRMRFRERRIGGFLVADRNVEQHVAGMVGPDLRRAFLDRIDKADHGRQRRPVDLDGLERIAGLIDGVRDHEGDRIADVAHFILRQDRIGRAGKRIDLQIEQARQIAEILDVVGGQHRADARHPAGLAGIDGELRMGVRRAQHQRVHRRLWRVVIGVAALAANQRIVFFAADALTDAELDGSRHRISGYELEAFHTAAVRLQAQTAFASRIAPAGRAGLGAASDFCSAPATKKAPDDAGALNDCRRFGRYQYFATTGPPHR
jgi:hypothetical protein